MSKPSLSLLLPLLSGAAYATTYSLSESYSGPTFYDNFNFITSDPSGGWVTYVDQETAQSNGYAYADNTGAYMGVDYTSTLDPSGPGRNSVRIESKTQFNKGLFIGDFAHMPTGCGLWPAFWMYGPDWPNNGEIDIMEGVNGQATDQISGHTSDGCVIAGGDSTATLDQNNCYQPQTNSGCYYVSGDSSAFGNGFNSNNGGVYAMEWTDDWINVWGWSRGNVPSDIASGNIDTTTWGTPTAQFAGSTCDIDSHFANMNIVLNTDFCGPWAGAVFSSMGCGSDCDSYVAQNPSAFQNAYWHVNSINIYTATSAPSEDDASHQSAQASPTFTSVVPLASKEPIYEPDSAMGSPVQVRIGTPYDGPMKKHVAGRVR